MKSIESRINKIEEELFPTPQRPVTVILNIRRSGGKTGEARNQIIEFTYRRDRRTGRVSKTVHRYDGETG